MMKNIPTGSAKAPRKAGGFIGLCGCVLVLFAATVRGAGQQQLRGQVPSAVQALKPVARMVSTNELKLAIGLPLRNQAALGQFLRDLSDPASPGYRHYLTPEEFAARFGPTEQDYQAVIAFARAHGFKISVTHPNRTLLDVSASVGDVEEAFHLTMGVYQHPKEKRTFYAPDAEPALDLAVPVLGISGLNDYARPQPRLHAMPLDARSAAVPNAGSGPAGTYRGNDFRAAYVPGTSLTGAGQKVGLLQFDGYTASDITYYESHAGLPAVPLINVLLDGFNGQPTGSGGEVEVSLDIEASISMAPGLSGVILYMAGPYGNFHDILNQMATDNLAKQLSCSWYIPGGGADPVADQIFQQMAAQGQSFFNASGDHDAFTGPVDFPGETPYITQVGGTTLTTTGPGGSWVSEKVWNWGGGEGSGGGISTRYAIPSYQTDISMTLNQGSTTMRNIPDVALTADNVYVRVDGSDYNVGGTSCAAPLWAGFAALVNEQAVKYGKPVIGLINSTVDGIGHLSTYTTCFHDITTGDNTSPGSPSKFHAVTGYDLCTGWGTPGGQRLIDTLAIPDSLLISPGLGLAFAGGVGGPFSPASASLTLTNVGTNTLNWTLMNTSAWFNVSLTHGTLPAHGPSTNVTVTVNPIASSLPAGLYSASLLFTNLSTGLGQSRYLALSVTATGMADDFDPGIDLTQWSAFGGSVQAANYGGSVSAPNSLWFGGAGSRYAATIPINTSAGGEIGFAIRLADGDNPPWAQVDNLPAEGVTLEYSTDGGGTWTSISNYDTVAYYDWTGVVMPIPAGAQANAAQFRWRQLSDSGTNDDNWALDNVAIATGTFGPRMIMDPPDQSVVVDTPAILTVAAIGSPALSYQWSFNGTNIDGATASSLVIPDAQFSDTGTYSVFLTNSLGAISSSNAVLTVTPPPPCITPPPGLVSWWPAEGDATDVLGVNNGVLMGGTTFTNGKVGEAFSFNGTSGTCVRIPYSTSLVTSTYSVEAWVNPLVQVSDPISQKVLFGQNVGRVQLVVRPGTTGVRVVFQFNFAGSYYQLEASSDIPLNQFTHVAATWDGTTQRLYLNGVLSAQAAPGATPGDPGCDFFIGGINSTAGPGGCQYSGQFFQGLIDEPSYYGRALSATEIQGIYHAGAAGKCQTPIPPSITVPPAGQTVAVGANPTFNVGAAGTPLLSYQWRFDGSNIAAATQSTLTLSNVQVAATGTYDVVVTNLYGSTNSAGAVLTVLVPPQIVTQPQGQIVAIGSNAVFNVTATGASPLAYQWRFDGNPISGATGTSLTVNVTSFSQAGNYSVLVSNIVGTTISSNALLVIPGNNGCFAPPANLVSWWPAEGDATDVTGANNGVLLGGTAFTNGEVGEAFSFNSAAATCVRIPYSASLATPTYSIEAWVNPLVQVSDPISQKVLFGQNVGRAQLLVQPGTTGVRVVFQFNSSGIWHLISASTDIPIGQFSHVAATWDGTTQKIYLNGVLNAQAAPNATPTDPGCDFFIGGINSTTGPGGCQYSGQFFQGLIDEPAWYGRALSATEIQGIYNAGGGGKCRSPIPPSITTPPTSQTVAVGANPTFNVVAAGTPPLTYQWRFDGSNIATATQSSLTLSNVQVAATGTYDVVVTNLYGSTNSAGAVLTVLVPPQIVTQPQGQVVAIGSNAVFNVAATGASPLAYQWRFNGTPISAATGTSLTVNVTSFSQAGSYSVLVSNTVGTMISSNALLVIPGDNGCFAPPANLVSWWPAEGDATDVTGANNGVLLGSTTFTNGEVGEAFSFNSTAATCVRIPYSASMGTPTYSIEAWVNPLVQVSDPIGQKVLFGQNVGRAQLLALPGNTGVRVVFQFISSGNWHTVESTSDIPLRQFTHVAATWDGTTQKIYLNGVLNIQATPNATPTDPGCDFFIGGINSTTGPGGCQYSGQFFQGLIDEPAWYGRALSLTEIQGIYHAGAAGKCKAAPPSILIPPQGQTVELAGNATFSVTATGQTPLSYRWFFGTNALGGATNSTLLLTNAGFAQTGPYSVVVTNIYGAATGGPALLTVVDTTPPTITACASNMTVSANINCAGIVPDLTGEIAATDASGPVTVSQNPPPGATAGLGTTTLTFSARDSSSNAAVCACSLTVVDTTPPFIASSVLEVTLGFDTNCDALLPNLTTTNYIVASDNCSPVSISQSPAAGTLMPLGTNSVVLTVSDAATNQTTRTVSVIVPADPRIVVQPADQAVTVGSGAVFGVQACAVSPIFYQWQHGGTNMPAATNASVNLAGTQPSDAGQYDVVVSNAYGSTTSATASLTLYYPPAITREPASQPAMPGCAVTLRSSASGTAPLNYQWWKDGAPLAGQTSTTLAYASIQTSNFGTYTLMVTNSHGSAISSNAVLFLDHAPVAVPDTIQRFAGGGVRVNASVLVANDTDADGDSLTLTSVSSNTAAGGTATFDGVWVYYAPPSGSTNSDTFTYVVSDGHCGTGVGTVTVQVKGTNDVNPPAFIENLGGGFFRVTCDGVPGHGYRFQRIASLPGSNWVDLGTLTADDFGTCEYIDHPSANTPARFYRTILP